MWKNLPFIYKFLIANDIGTDFSLLYEEHAAVLGKGNGRLAFGLISFPGL